MKTLKNRKWFALKRKQRAPNVRSVTTAATTYVEVVESDEVLRVVHVAEHYAWDRDGFCLLKEDYKKIAHIPHDRLIVYSGLVSHGSIRHLADSVKVALADRWVPEPTFPRPQQTKVFLDLK